jgi:serine/threonine-protein kinase
MGAVYEVERVADGRRLALKVLTGNAGRAALARFAREAQVAAELDHPNVISVVDIDVTRSGTLFVVMELVAGGSLASARARYGDLGFALPVLVQVARALSAMHARGSVRCSRRSCPSPRRRSSND